jgi:hypothetical protein
MAHAHATGTPINSSPANQINPTISASSVAALYQSSKAPTAVFHISRELPRVGLVIVASASFHNFIELCLLSYVFCLRLHAASIFRASVWMSDVDTTAIVIDGI